MQTCDSVQDDLPEDQLQLRAGGQDLPAWRIKPWNAIEYKIDNQTRHMSDKRERVFVDSLEFGEGSEESGRDYLGQSLRCNLPGQLRTASPLPSSGDAVRS